MKFTYDFYKILEYNINGEVIIPYLKNKIDIFYNNLINLNGINSDFIDKKELYNFPNCYYSYVDNINDYNLFKIYSNSYQSKDTIQNSINNQLFQNIKYYDFINENLFDSQIGLQLSYFMDITDIFNIPNNYSQLLKYDFSNYINFKCEKFIYNYIFYTNIYTNIDVITNISKDTLIYIKCDPSLNYNIIKDEFSYFINETASHICSYLGNILLVQVFNVVKPKYEIKQIVNNIISKSLIDLKSDFLEYSKYKYEEIETEIFNKLKHSINILISKTLTNIILGKIESNLDDIVDKSNNVYNIEFEKFVNLYKPQLFNSDLLSTYFKLPNIYRNSPIKFLNILDWTIEELVNYNIQFNNNWKNDLDNFVDNININNEDLTLSTKIIFLIVDRIIQSKLINYITNIYLIKFIDNFISSELFINYKLNLLKDLETKLIEKNYNTNNTDSIIIGPEYIDLYFKSFFKSNILSDRLFSQLSNKITTYYYNFLYPEKTTFILNKKDLLKHNDQIYGIPINGTVSNIEVNYKPLDITNTYYKAVIVDNNLLYFNIEPNSPVYCTIIYNKVVYNNEVNENGAIIKEYITYKTVTIKNVIAEKFHGQYIIPISTNLDYISYKITEVIVDGKNILCDWLVKNNVLYLSTKFQPKLEYLLQTIYDYETIDIKVYNYLNQEKTNEFIITKFINSNKFVLNKSILDDDYIIIKYKSNNIDYVETHGLSIYPIENKTTKIFPSNIYDEFNVIINIDKNKQITETLISIIDTNIDNLYVSNKIYTTSYSYNTNTLSIKIYDKNNIDKTNQYTIITKTENTFELDNYILKTDKLIVTYDQIYNNYIEENLIPDMSSTDLGIIEYDNLEFNTTINYDINNIIVKIYDYNKVDKTDNYNITYYLNSNKIKLNKNILETDSLEAIYTVNNIVYTDILYNIDKNPNSIDIKNKIEFYNKFNLSYKYNKLDYDIIDENGRNKTNEYKKILNPGTNKLKFNKKLFKTDRLYVKYYESFFTFTFDIVDFINTFNQFNLNNLNFDNMSDEINLIIKSSLTDYLQETIKKYFKK